MLSSSLIFSSSAANMDTMEKAGVLGLDKHPRSDEKDVLYGTAGFRMRAEKLDHIVYRMGVLCALFSKHRSGVTGIMITASHNPEEDNGVKLIDTMGEMMPMSWEKHATALANASNENLPKCLGQIVSCENIDMTKESSVYLAMDTRPSSESLIQAATDGVEVMNGNHTNFGLLTTPQLHFIICCKNTNGRYGNPCEEGYYTKLSKAYLELNQKTSFQKYVPKVYLDLANGVSAPKITKLKTFLKDKIEIETYNDGSSGKLNHECGADFVKLHQSGPLGMNLEPGMRCVSFDGDGDRIVYFYKTADGNFSLLDGDKIATLIAAYLNELVKESGLTLNLGLVQTAYANGGSTEFITKFMQVPVACVPTGVKYLHHEAQNFDIGVYFEANGHGTVLFSDSASNSIKSQASSDGLDEKTKKAAIRLSAMMDLINQTVGDAMSDLLVVETILAVRDWSCCDWDNMYGDLANRQLKVKVEDRCVVQTTNAERTVTQPPGLQDAIDALVSGYKHGRSFVRPSGTEDVVRVYAEADNQTNADQLAYEVAMQVYSLAKGTGDKPKAP